MKLRAALLLLLSTALSAAAFEVEPELYGAYRFCFSNVEYDTPPAPRPDERTHLLQRLEVGLRWALADWARLETGLEVQHDLADALEYDVGNWDNFRLNPRLRLEADFGGWGLVRLGHFTAELGPETLHVEPYDHPAAGLGWWGEEPGLSWSLFGARTSRVTTTEKEVFLAGGRLAPRLGWGFLTVEPRLVFAYRHAGGYDTADYQGFEPPDGVRKEELWNLGGGLELSLDERSLFAGGGYFASVIPQIEGHGSLTDFYLGGAFWWLELGAALFMGEGYRGVRPMSALAPGAAVGEVDDAGLKLLDLAVKLRLPLLWGTGLFEVRQGFFFDGGWRVADNRNRLTLRLDFAF